MSITKTKQKLVQRKRRHTKIKAKIKGNNKYPRLNVFRSNFSMFLQIIDDSNQRTILSVNNKEIKEKGNKTEIAYKMGELIAEKALKNNIKKVVFDRGGYKYHGRVKAVAEGARKGGLKF